MSHHSQVWTDEQVLQILDRHERGKESSTDIARTYGVSRSSVLGVLFRVNAATDRAEEGSYVTKPENMDGGMPPCWWKKRARAR
jgi:hypothetical protein